jgi:hypothetical protein
MDFKARCVEQPSFEEDMDVDGGELRKEVA